MARNSRDFVRGAHEVPRKFSVTLTAKHLIVAAMPPDDQMLARLARARLQAERRQRLGFDERRKIKQLAELERRALNGEIPTPPKPGAVAPEISEGEIRRACRDLHEGFRQPLK